jgi:hypothetical protein
MTAGLANISKRLDRLERARPPPSDDYLIDMILKETSEEDLDIISEVVKIRESSPDMTEKQILEGLSDEKLQAYAAAVERFSVRHKEYLAAATLLGRKPVASSSGG